MDTTATNDASPSDATIEQAARRGARAAKLGQTARCASCGTDDLVILQQATLTLCPECRLRLQGKSATELHHIAGRHNDPTTVSVPANVHGALTDRQHDWPPATLRNPEGSPLRYFAAWIRGLLDHLRHALAKADLLVAFLERLDDALTNAHGTRWWLALGLDGALPA